MLCSTQIMNLALFYYIQVQLFNTFRVPVIEISKLLNKVSLFSTKFSIYH